MRRTTKRIRKEEIEKGERAEAEKEEDQEGRRMQ